MDFFDISYIADKRLTNFRKLDNIKHIGIRKNLGTYIIQKRKDYQENDIE